VKILITTDWYYPAINAGGDICTKSNYQAMLIHIAKQINWL